jgi:hypothetical protein
VLWTIENVEVVQKVNTKTVLREHTLYNVLDKALVTLVTSCNECRVELLLTTGIT